MDENVINDKCSCYYPSKLLKYVQALHSWNSVLTLYFCFWHFIIIKTFKESLCYIYVAFITVVLENCNIKMLNKINIKFHTFPAVPVPMTFL